jgi:pyruvate, water dikinase
LTYTLRFEDCRQDDLARVGGKCASLGELLEAGLPVPPGFAVTTEAFTELLAADGLGARIHAELVGLDTADVDALAVLSDRLRAAIEAARVPQPAEQAIREGYRALEEVTGIPDLPVAVRSSATAEDLPGASFAGQQDTYLWVVGAESLLEHVKRCWSSLYTARAIAYRHDNGFAHEQVLMSVAVQKMVRARAAGVAMTLNPANGDRSKIVIDASFGLGETVVGGLVTPDNFVIDKVILDVVKRTISPKHVELVPDLKARCVVERPIEAERRLEPSLALDEVKAVARLAKEAERHYGCPQDVEWALDDKAGGTRQVVLLQSRPETVWSQRALGPAPARYETGLAGVLSTLMNPLAARKKESSDD